MDATGIMEVSVAFKDEENNQFYATDYNGDGVAELNITDQMLSGNYTFFSIMFNDDTTLRNNSVYYSDGQLYADEDSSTHNVDLSNLDFVVDNTPPTNIINKSLKDMFLLKRF